MATKEIVVEKQALLTVENAELKIIANANDMEQATSILSRLNQFSKDLKAEKEKVTKPLNEALKAERERFRPTEEKLEAAILSIRKKMSAYQTAQKKREDEEAAKIAARIGAGKGKLKVETAVEKIDAIDRVASKVSTEAGSVSFRTDKKFEVMDVTLLPADCILPNEVAIRAAMKNGIELPGVRYYEEQVPINRR